MPDSAWQDLRYGVRQLLSHPGFTITVVLTLALGIGINTSIFSVLNALMLRPLPVPDSANLVSIYRGNARPCSYADYVDLNHETSTFTGLAADATNEAALDIGGRSEVILTEMVSPNYAAVLELRATLGRWFTPDDRDFPAVISYRIWQTRLAGNPRVIGTSVHLDSRWYTIIGVAPQDFQGMALPILTDVWVPLPAYAQHNEFAASLVTKRSAGTVLMFGRLKPNIAGAQAQGELNTLDVPLWRDSPHADSRFAPLRLERARGTTDPGTRRMVLPLLLLLSLVVVLVLLIACANIANLLFARSVSRQGEICIRLALGANRARICRQLLLESLLLGLLGSSVGLAAAFGMNRLFESALAAAPVPEALGTHLSLDGRVLIFVLAAAVATTFLFGLLPALQSSKPDLLPMLKGTAPLNDIRRFTLTNISMVLQVALSVTLLISAGLFLRALSSASHIDPGFDSRQLLSARLYVAKSELGEAAARVLYRQALVRARSLPGVRSVTLSYDSPTIATSECVIPSEPETKPMEANTNIVGSAYFSTLGIPLLRGRDFSPTDSSSAPPVAIVSETLARKYWPGNDAIGRRIRIGPGCEQGRGDVASIVGVAKDAQYATIDTSLQPFVFLPWEQRFAGYVSLVARTDGNPLTVASLLRHELHSLDNRLRIYDIDVIAYQIDQSLWRTRWEASLFGALGGLALVIAAVGLYGVIAFTTRQRTREFGIRLALGATSGDVFRLVLSESLTLVLVGLGLGAVSSFALARLLRGFLFGLSPADTFTYTLTGALWVAVALLAASRPGARATHIDPAVTLRDE